MSTRHNTASQEWATKMAQLPGHSDSCLHYEASYMLEPGCGHAHRHKTCVYMTDRKGSVGLDAKHDKPFCVISNCQQPFKHGCSAVQISRW